MAKKKKQLPKATMDKLKQYIDDVTSGKIENPFATQTERARQNLIKSGLIKKDPE